MTVKTDNSLMQPTTLRSVGDFTALDSRSAAKLARKAGQRGVELRAQQAGSTLTVEVIGAPSDVGAAAKKLKGFEANSWTVAPDGYDPTGRHTIVVVVSDLRNLTPRYLAKVGRVAAHRDVDANVDIRPFEGSTTTYGHVELTGELSDLAKALKALSPRNPYKKVAEVRTITPAPRAEVAAIVPKEAAAPVRAVNYEGEAI